MAKNSNIEVGHWYKHTNMKDVVVKCNFKSDDVLRVQYWNVAGPVKFPIEEEYLFQSAFDSSPHWNDVTQEMIATPTKKW